MVRLAEHAFGRLPSGSAVTDSVPPQRPRAPKLVAVEHRESQTELRLSFLAAAEDHADFPALLLLRRILDDGLAARLQLNVVERKGLAYAVHGSIDTFSDCSVFEVEAACAPRKAPLVLAELLRLLSELCDEDVPEDELRRAKVRHRIGLEFALDSAGEMIGWFGGTELFRTPEGFDERVAKLEAVTARDLRRVATATFRRDALVACAVGPISTIEKRLSAAVDDAQGLPR
jgi:predicted Zn-dependent peptidase